MPENKRHHYVPKMVLRNFATDPEKRSIALFVFSSRQRIDGASIRSQCYEAYFYGTTPEVEESFAEEEGRFAAILGDLSPAHLESASREDLIRIKSFVHLQRLRTVKAAAAVNALADGFFQHVISGVDGGDEFELQLENPQFLTLQTAASTLPVVQDLDVKFVINNRATGFVISDAAVATYNQWAEHHPKFSSFNGYKGVATRGLQWFYPVSPSVAIAVFDPGAYTYGSPRSRICMASSRDVRKLNELQAIHARESIYFDPTRMSQDALPALADARVHHPDLQKPTLQTLGYRERPDGKRGELVRMSTPDPRLGVQFNFVQIIDASTYEDYDGIIVPPRSQELVDLSREIERLMDKDRQQERDQDHPDQ